MSDQYIPTFRKNPDDDLPVRDIDLLLQQAIRCARKMVMSDPTLSLRDRHERFFDLLREACSYSSRNISTREYDRSRAAISYRDERRLSLSVACCFALRGFMGNSDTFSGGSGVLLVSVMHVRGIPNIAIIKSYFRAKDVNAGRVPPSSYVSVVHKDAGVVWARLWDSDRTDDRGITSPFVNDEGRQWNMISSNEGFEIAIQSVCDKCPDEVEFGDHDFVRDLIDGWNAQGYVTAHDIGWGDSSASVSKSLSTVSFGVTKGVVIGKTASSMDIDPTVVVSGLKKRAQELMKGSAVPNHQADFISPGVPNPIHLGLFKESVEIGQEQAGTTDLNSFRRDTLSELIDSTIDTKFIASREFKTLSGGLAAAVLVAGILSDDEIEAGILTAMVVKISSAIRDPQSDPGGPQIMWSGEDRWLGADQNTLARRLTTFIAKAERPEEQPSSPGSIEDDKPKDVL